MVEPTCVCPSLVAPLDFQQRGRTRAYVCSALEQESMNLVSGRISRLTTLLPVVRDTAEICQI